MKKVYRVNTTAGVVFGIGVFSNGEMLKGGSPTYYKTEKGATKALKRMMG